MVIAEGYEVADADEYCAELCYHESLCGKDPDCIDIDCYYECISLNEIEM